ncbi:MAG: RNA-binding cell elongation regulator Jag/EloR [Chloroflexota bacterium]
MSEYQEFTGKSVEEALKNAREAFDVAGLEDLDFEILTQGSRGVLGMGAEPARIIAAPRSALAAGASARKVSGSTKAAESAAEPAATQEPAPASDPGLTVATDPEPVATPEPAAIPAASKAPADSSASSGRGRSRGSGQSREASTVGGAASAEVEAAVAAGSTSAPARKGDDDDEASPEALAAGKEILEQLVLLTGYDARVEVTTGPSAKITVFGVDEEQKEALGALIGRKGERLSALQHLVNLMLSRKMGTWTRVLVDVEDYRGRRERQLVEVAQRAAERVEETGQMLQLEPMSALERRWVHIALRDVEGVSTQSIGEEPMRRVVVLKA